MAENQEEMQSLQEKFVLYQVLQSRVEDLKKHIPGIQQKAMEYEATNQALFEINKIKKGNDLLVPLGSGFYTHSKVDSTEDIVVDIGAGVMAKKSLEDSLKFIEKKKKEIQSISEQLQFELNQIVGKMNEIGPELQKAVEAQQGKPEYSE